MIKLHTSAGLRLAMSLLFLMASYTTLLKYNILLHKTVIKCSYKGTHTFKHLEMKTLL